MNEVLAPIYYVFCQEIDDAAAMAATPAPHPPSASHAPAASPPPSPPDDPLGLAEPLSVDPLSSPIETEDPTEGPTSIDDEFDALVNAPTPSVRSSSAAASVAATASKPAAATATAAAGTIASAAAAASSAPLDPLSTAAADPLSGSTAASGPLDVSDAASASSADASSSAGAFASSSAATAAAAASGADAASGGGASASAVDPLGAGDLPGPLLEALDAVEADAFFCFTHLMAELRDHFCSKLDHTEIGITAKITKMERLIESKDPELGRKLKSLRVAPTFYGFRWITLLMTQEWDLPDVLILWDTLLADPSRFEFLLYFCVATITSIRTDLIAKDDFAFAVKALQRFDGRVPMHALLRRAHTLYAEDHPAGRQQP